MVLVGCGQREESRAAEVVVSPESVIYASDHLTGASFLVLDPSGSYQVVSQEHMGVWVTEKGKWAQAEAHITFHTSGSDKKSYRTAVSQYKGKEFLVQLDEDGPTIRMPLEAIRKEIDDAEKEPGTGPPQFVFVRMNSKVTAGDLSKTYPFKFYREMNKK